MKKIVVQRVIVRKFPRVERINETLKVRISIACEEWPKKLHEAEATIKGRISIYQRLTEFG